MAEQEARRLTEDEYWELYVTSQAPLVRFARRMTSDWTLAEDAVAEAFVSVLKLIRRGGGPTRQTFISYMRVCVRNEVIRVSNAGAKEDLADNLEEIIENRQPVDLESDAENTWDADAARRAFEALSHRDRTLLQLSDIEGVKQSKIAEDEGISVSSVAVGAYRARDALRTNYLIEVVANDESCATMRVDYLAAFARGKSPALRRVRVEKHLDDCALCTHRVKRMISFRLPTLAILGLATSGAIVGQTFGERPAAAAADDDVAGEVAGEVARGAAKRRTGRIALACSALVIIVIFALIVLRPGGNVDNATRNVDNAASAGAETSDAESPSPDDDDKADSSEAPSVPPSAPPSATAVDPSQNSVDVDSPDIVNKPKPEAPELPGLPAGVRQVQWEQAPATYVAGGEQVRLLLNVDFDDETRPDDYVVVIVPPAGVTITTASAGCSIQADQVVCRPMSRMLSLRSFSFQFLTDLVEDASLPTATVKIR